MSNVCPVLCSFGLGNAGLWLLLGATELDGRKSGVLVEKFREVGVRAEAGFRGNLGYRYV